ncbi:hypothetical protein BHE74_00022163 [Ensete ventricosum]|nr:hypothetical protein GW17_00001867 [Ensete ventricosum]RWW70167.1 hypothetical protein BHE74_00022163 [Ensete ventricosum]RZS12886.1 hypothetical protein BHM03_00044395 [Ensete ventricosum]
MILRAPSALVLRSPSPKTSPSGAAYWLRSGLRVPRERARNGSVVAMAAGEANSRPTTGVVFEPFEELKKELDLVPSVPDKSIARQKYSDECEAAINEQIKWVAERCNDIQMADFIEAEFLGKQVNSLNIFIVIRKLVLFLVCICLALLTALKCFQLTWEGSFSLNLCTVQVEDIKKISEYVAQLRRVGKEHGKVHSAEDIILHLDW